MRTEEAVSSMLCPVCRTGLSMSDRGGVEIDFCPSCRGVWLDRGELDKIIERTAPQPARDVTGDKAWGRAEMRADLWEWLPLCCRVMTSGTTGTGMTAMKSAMMIGVRRRRDRSCPISSINGQLGRSNSSTLG